MLIKVDKWGCCLSDTCPFKGECAQHTSAGDFRTEDGFTPEIENLNGLVCHTFHEIRLPSDQRRPSNYWELDRGFISKESLGERRVPRVNLKLNFEEIGGLIEYHHKMIQAYGEIPDETQVASGHTVGYHKKQRQKRINELIGIKDDTWPK